MRPGNALQAGDQEDRAQRTDIGQPVRSFPVEGRALAPLLAAARHYDAFVVHLRTSIGTTRPDLAAGNRAASRPAEKSADWVQRLHLTRRRPLFYVQVGNWLSARAILHPSGCPQDEEGPGVNSGTVPDLSGITGAGADRAQTFFWGGVQLMYTFTKSPKYTRAARARRRELPDSRQ